MNPFYKLTESTSDADVVLTGSHAVLNCNSWVFWLVYLYLQWNDQQNEDLQIARSKAKSQLYPIRSSFLTRKHRRGLNLAHIEPQGYCC